MTKPRFDWGCVAFRPMSEGFPRVMFPYGETATTLQSTSLCRQCLFTFLPTCFKRINSLRLDVVQNHVYRSISERRSIIDVCFIRKEGLKKVRAEWLKDRDGIDLTQSFHKEAQWFCMNHVIYVMSSNVKVTRHRLLLKTSKHDFSVSPFT